MEISHIDHVNLHVPPDALEAAREFYVEKLGQELVNVDAYESGEKPFFTVHLAPEHVLHLWPTEEFEPPGEPNFNHVALVVDATIEELDEELEEAGVPVEREREGLTGAIGEGASAYVRDPFGYQLELKAGRS